MRFSASSRAGRSFHRWPEGEIEAHPAGLFLMKSAARSPIMMAGALACAGLAARLLVGLGPVRVAAVADGVDLHLVLRFVDAVDDPVGPAPSRVEAVERLV